MSHPTTSLVVSSPLQVLFKTVRKDVVRFGKHLPVMIHVRSLHLCRRPEIRIVPYQVTGLALVELLNMLSSMRRTAMPFASADAACGLCR